MVQDNKKISESINEAEWAWIKPHLDRNAVIIVHRNLDLLDVGVCIAQNKHEKVQEWIAKSWMTKPSAIQIEMWDKEPTKRFLILILQPYVLVQEITTNVIH